VNCGIQGLPRDALEVLALDTQAFQSSLMQGSPHLCLKEVPLAVHGYVALIPAKRIAPILLYFKPPS